jgi:hypothetical protein
MIITTPERRVAVAAVLAVVFVVTLAFAASASGTATSDAGKIAKLERHVTTMQRQMAATERSRVALQKRLLVVSVSSRTAYVEWLGLHGIDAGFNMNTGLSSVNVERFNNAAVVLRDQRWPADLRADAESVAKYLSDAVAANARGDRQAEKTAVMEAHEQYHLLAPLAYAWVRKNR